MSAIVKGLIVITSLAAAICWYKAATAKAPAVGGLLGKDDQLFEGTFSEKEGYQMLADAALQSWWNARAAICATAAAVLTAVDSLL